MARYEYDFLIVGGGRAAATAIRELVVQKPGARIGLLAAEGELPYDRPPLSKAFLLGSSSRDSLFLMKDEFYGDNGVDVRLSTPAEAVDISAHLVQSGGDEFAYSKLLIASGCSLRRLQCRGADLPGLHYLRTLPESEALSAAIERAKQAVVIGGGFVGLEVASVIAQREVRTTVIHRAARLLEKFDNDAISSYFEDMYLDNGVSLVYEDEAVALNGDGRVESVTTRGERSLPCDLAVAGIGVMPDTAYLESSGLELSNGVLVDEYMRTADPDIYAAGDIANFQDPVYGRHRRIEHWDNAIRQGRTAARNMAGGQEQYCCVSFFYSTVFGTTYDFYGDMSGCDEQVMRGSFGNGSCAVFYLQAGVLKAAFMLRRPRSETRAVVQLITERKQLDGVRDRLGDEQFGLEQALAA